MRRPWWRAAGLTLLVVIVVFSALAGFQRRLIYFPDQQVPVPPAGIETVRTDTGDGLTLSGWLSPAGAGATLLLVFHGNGGDHADRLPLATALGAHGVAVLLCGYRGYGGNPGSPSEAGMAADARAWRAWADANHDGPVAYFGESLGTGVATRLAVEAAPSALALRSPFPSLAALGGHHYPFLPVGALLRDRYEQASRIVGVDAPLLVVAGGADTLVPPAQSRALFDAAGEPKRWVLVEGARHNDLALLAGDALVSAVVELL